MDGYGAMFAAQAASPTLREIWQAAYGADYPADADPLSFVTQTDLDRILASLDLAPDDRLVDLACGAGGPGVHVARAVGVRLTGIDVSPGAVEIARNRHLPGIRAGSAFEAAPFDDTGLADGFADAVMSTDALFYAEDRDVLFGEIARIGKPKCRLAFTSFELRSRSNALNAGPVLDYRAPLESAGFEVDVYEATPDWEARMRAVFAGILDKRDALERELGAQMADGVAAWATLRPNELHDSRRVFVSAHRPERS